MKVPLPIGEQEIARGRPRRAERGGQRRLGVVLPERQAREQVARQPLAPARRIIDEVGADAHARLVQAIVAEQPRRGVDEAGRRALRVLTDDDAELLDEGRQVHVLAEEHAAGCRAPAADGEGRALGGRRRGPRPESPQDLGARLEQAQLVEGEPGAAGHALDLLPQEWRVRLDRRAEPRGRLEHGAARGARLRDDVAGPRLHVIGDERGEHRADGMADLAPGALGMDEREDRGLAHGRHCTGSAVAGPAGRHV